MVTLKQPVQNLFREPIQPDLENSRFLYVGFYSNPDSKSQEIIACGIQNPGPWNLEFDQL